MATRRSTKGIGEQGKGMKVFVLAWVGLGWAGGESRGVRLCWVGSDGSGCIGLGSVGGVTPGKWKSRVQRRVVPE